MNTWERNSIKKDKAKNETQSQIKSLVESDTYLDKDWNIIILCENKVARPKFQLVFLEQQCMK